MIDMFSNISFDFGINGFVFFVDLFLPVDQRAIEGEKQQKNKS